MACAFAKRQEDGCTVETIGVGGVDAPNGKGLLIHIAIGGVDREADVVTHFQVQFVRDRLADQHSLAVIRGQVIPTDDPLAIRIVRG